MITLKSSTIVGALLAGGTSLAMAQGPGTGGYPPVAGGAGGNPTTNPNYIGAAQGYGLPVAPLLKTTNTCWSRCGGSSSAICNVTSIRRGHAMTDEPDDYNRLINELKALPAARRATKVASAVCL